MITDVRPRVRLLDAAGELDLFELAPALLAELSMPSATLRFAAARALGRLADAGSVPVLQQLAVADPVEDVRDAASRALRAIEEQAAQDGQAKEDEDPGDEAAGDASS